MSKVPVITIDGPSGAGKGTVSQALAEKLNYHLLDSGAVYRAAGLHAIEAGADLTDEASVMSSLESMQATFTPQADGVRVYLAGNDVTGKLRSEATAEAASKVAVMPSVRALLLAEQRSFRTQPGLIADGRDMGSVVFPDACVKVYLFASAEVRASRRARQLKDKGMEVTIASLVKDIAARDERDSSREHSPLFASQDALQIDSSSMSIDDVVEQIMLAVAKQGLIPVACS